MRKNTGKNKNLRAVKFGEEFLKISCHFLFNITSYRKLPGMSRSLLWYDPTRMVAWEMPLGLDARFFFSLSSSVLPRQHAVNRHFYHILECRARINTRDGEAKMTSTSLAARHWLGGDHEFCKSFFFLLTLECHSRALKKKSGCKQWFVF